MSIFISKTLNSPYDKIDDLTTNESLTIDSVSDQSIISSDPKYLYLIVEGEYHDQIELLVENETATGVSFYISEVDPLGVPLKWRKQIILNNVDGKSSIYKFAFVYQWQVINNLYLVKDVHPSARLNIYAIDKYDT